MDRKDNCGGSNESMDSYLSFSWHGAHDGGDGKNRGIGATVHVARDVRGGQFDLYFCLTKCLRSNLNFCIDELDKKIRGQKSQSKKPLKGARQKAASLSFHINSEGGVKWI
jgi:hypothetical protein